MIRCALFGACLLSLSVAVYTASGKAPAEVLTPAKVEILAAEAEAQSAKLGELLATKEGYEAQQADTMKKRLVPQAAGAIAVVAQVLAEHPQKAESKINPTALRAAAIAVQKASKYEEALAAYEQIKTALAGMGEAGPVEFDWTELTDTHNMMEEVNARSAQLGRSLRRPRDLGESIRDATVLALFAVVMEHDTNYVLDEGKLPQWKKYAVTYRDNMLKVAESLRANDTAAARTAYNTGIRACDFCHEDFRAN